MRCEGLIQAFSRYSCFSGNFVHAFGAGNLIERGDEFRIAAVVKNFGEIGDDGFVVCEVLGDVEVGDVHGFYCNVFITGWQVMGDEYLKPLSDYPILAEYYRKRFDVLQARFSAAGSEQEAREIALDLMPLANWLAALENNGFQAA